MLVIRHAEVDDEATYKCVAENIAGETEKLTNVVVLGKTNPSNYPRLSFPVSFSVP